MRRTHLFVFAAITVILLSCRKMDIGKQTIPTPANTEYAKRFFTVPSSTNEVVARVANYIRAQNEVKSFAEKLVRFDGFAKWDKAYIQVNNSTSTYIKVNSTSTNSSSSSTNSGDSIVYIPLVPENSEYVYSFIAAKVNGDDISWRLFSGRDYDKYPYGKENPAAITADKIAMVSMILDYQTFGYTSFTVSDTKLFNSGNFSSNKPKQIKLTPRNVNTQNTLASTKVGMNTTYMYIEYCFSYSYQSCPYDPCRGPGGTCDRCGECMVNQTSCFEKMIALPSGGGGGTVANPPPPGGGGGDDGIPGNGDSPDDPCDINSPCGRQGWTADESLALNLAADLGLNFNEKEWLEDHPEHAIDIRDYLTNSSTSEPEKIELAKKHIDGLKNNPDYLQFVTNYAGNNPNAEDMWWENDTWISDANNISFSGYNQGYDALNAEEKILVKKHPVVAAIMNENRKSATEATINVFGQNGRNDKSDAFRHAFFNALNEITCTYFEPQTPGLAKQFSDAHETTTPVHLIMEKNMDYWNNTIGQAIGANKPSTYPELTLIGDVMTKIFSGELVYLNPIWYTDPNFNYTGGITSSTVLIPTNQ